MNNEQQEAARNLANFANSHAEEVYGDESDQAQLDMDSIQADADIVLGYLDNVKN